MHNKTICVPVCGDGFVSPCPTRDGWPEQCDDGNRVDGDGCSALCLMEPASADGGAGG